MILFQNTLSVVMIKRNLCCIPHFLRYPFFFKLHGNPTPLHWNRNLRFVGSALLFFIIIIFRLSGFWVSFPPPQLPETMLRCYNFRTAQYIYTNIRSKSNNLIQSLKDRKRYGYYTTFGVKKKRIFNVMQGFA